MVECWHCLFTPWRRGEGEYAGKTYCQKCWISFQNDIGEKDICVGCSRRATTRVFDRGDGKGDAYYCEKCIAPYEKKHPIKKHKKKPKMQELVKQRVCERCTKPFLLDSYVEDDENLCDHCWKARQCPEGSKATKQSSIQDARFVKYESDKSSVYHGCANDYEMLLFRRDLSTRSSLEVRLSGANLQGMIQVGSAASGGSSRAWRQYFAACKDSIVAIDKILSSMKSEPEDMQGRHDETEPSVDSRVVGSFIPEELSVGPSDQIVDQSTMDTSRTASTLGVLHKPLGVAKGADVSKQSYADEWQILSYCSEALDAILP